MYRISQYLNREMLNENKFNVLFLYSVKASIIFRKFVSEKYTESLLRQWSGGIVYFKKQNHSSRLKCYLVEYLFRLWNRNFS